MTDFDCSQQGERTCDTTQPNGYCTIADCDPRSCPEKESVCVSFNSVRSTVGVCRDPGQPSPHARNFCMAACDSGRDCRPGYLCTEVSSENPWGAAIIERSPASRRVCLLDIDYLPIEDERADGFCRAGVSAGIGGASPQ